MTSPPPPAHSPERAAVLAIMRDSTAPLGPSAVFDKLPEGVSTPGSIKNMLPELYAEGYLDRGKRGEYTYVTDDPAAALRNKAARSGGDGAPGVVPFSPAAAHSEASGRVRVAVIEVAGGQNGMLALDEVTIRHDELTAEQFTFLFQSPPPANQEDARRFVIAHLRGESMVPRYFDHEDVPIEMFESPLTDVPSGDVYLVRLEGHLYLKVLDREMGDREAKPPVRGYYVLKSFNRMYSPIRVPIRDGVDFCVLGRVRERNKDRLYAALLANQMGFKD